MIKKKYISSIIHPYLYLGLLVFSFIFLIYFIYEANIFGPMVIIFFLPLVFLILFSLVLSRVYIDDNEIYVERMFRPIKKKSVYDITKIEHLGAGFVSIRFKDKTSVNFMGKLVDVIFHAYSPKNIVKNIKKRIDKHIHSDTN